MATFYYSRKPFIHSAILTLFLLTARTSALFLTQPRNAVAILGQRAVFNCSTILQQPISWRFAKPGETHSIIIFMGRNATLANDLSETEVANSTTPGEYDLVIKSVAAEHAGTYVCHENRGYEAGHAADLVVLKYAPVCNASVEEGLPQTIAGERIQFCCTLEYFGSLPHELFKWTYSDEYPHISVNQTLTIIDSWTMMTSCMRIVARSPRVHRFTFTARLFYVNLARNIDLPPSFTWSSPELEVTNQFETTVRSDSELRFLSDINVKTTIFAALFSVVVVLVILSARCVVRWIVHRKRQTSERRQSRSTTTEQSELARDLSWRQHRSDTPGRSFQVDIVDDEPWQSHYAVGCINRRPDYFLPLRSGPAVDAGSSNVAQSYSPSSPLSDDSGMYEEINPYPEVRPQEPRRPVKYGAVSLGKTPATTNRTQTINTTPTYLTLLPEASF